MRLLKLHGLGNDFLVLLDEGSVGPVAPERVRALCHRWTGVGADGLIRSERAGEGTITFSLINADGRAAEMSGNGARCLGLAAVREGWWADRSHPLVLTTPVGDRQVDWQGGDLEAAQLRVGMGVVGPFGDASDLGRVLPDAPDEEGAAYGWMVSVGNRHAVGLFEGTLPAISDVEPALSRIEVGGPSDMNYEFVVRGPEPEALTMIVRERGAGWTQACGTGSVAAAWAANRQGWVGHLVTVHNPGGAVQVDLSGTEARLTGPAVFVAAIDVPS